MESIHMLVFSFNRGRFLEHCVASIEACAPNASVFVYDDDSDDPQTCEVLARLAAKHTVIKAGDLAASRGRHGGLYANMQSAIEAVPDGQLFCCLQDDMQLVRALDAEELLEWRGYLREHRESAFLHPCFLKGSNRQRDLARTRFRSDLGYYRRLPEVRGAGVYYADVMMSLGGRLQAHGWEFDARESANEAQARAALPPMDFLFAPFVMWLPAVPVYRGKRRTWALRLAEHLMGCGFHPFDLLSQAQAQSLKTRSPDQLPIAEDWLKLTSRGPKPPWRYDPFQGSKVLRHLDRIERGVAHLFGR